MRASPRKSIPRTFPPCWKVLLRPSAASLQPMPKSRPPTAALINEASLHSAGGAGPRGYCGLHSERNPQAALRVRAAILESLQNLVLFPQVGRQQKVEGVRKLVTRHYPYLVYYTADESAEEILSLIHI